MRGNFEKKNIVVWHVYRDTVKSHIKHTWVQSNHLIQNKNACENSDYNTKWEKKFGEKVLVEALGFLWKRIVHEFSICYLHIFLKISK